MKELLSTATIGKTHGVDGFLRIYSLSGEYAHLRKLRNAVASFPDGKEKLLTVSEIRSKGDLFLMKFSGYETPESARELSGERMQGNCVRASIMLLISSGFLSCITEKLSAASRMFPMAPRRCFSR